MAMSVCQGGSGLPFLAEPVYNYLCTGELREIEITTEDIPDPSLQFVIQKVRMKMKCHLKIFTFYCSSKLLVCNMSEKSTYLN